MTATEQATETDTGGTVAQDIHEYVNTPPYNAPVGKGQKTAESRDNQGFARNEQTADTIGRLRDAMTTESETAPPPHAPVVNVEKEIKQAGFGMLICEHCGNEVERKTHNQRFCCTDCRMNFHGFTPGKKKG